MSDGEYIENSATIEDNSIIFNNCRRSDKTSFNV